MVEKVRKLQNASCAHLAKSALKLQGEGLAQWLQTASEHDAADHQIIGFSLMWDEASQKLKGLLTKPQALGGTARADKSKGAFTAPKQVEVMVAMGHVYQMKATIGESGAVQRQSKWQPWLAPVFDSPALLA